MEDDLMRSYRDIIGGYCEPTASAVGGTVVVLFFIALAGSAIGGVVLGFQHADALDSDGWWLIGQILGGTLKGIWSIAVFVVMSVVGGLALLLSAEIVAMLTCLIVGAIVYFQQNEPLSSSVISQASTTSGVRRTMNEIREAARRGEIEFDQ
jgi:hypothetical protein